MPSSVQRKQEEGCTCLKPQLRQLVMVGQSLRKFCTLGSTYPQCTVPGPVPPAVSPSAPRTQEEGNTCFLYLVEIPTWAA